MIQRRIVDRLKSEIDRSIGKVSPALEVYHEEYLKEIDRFERTASRRELIDACAAAEIVYCGDYHTLRQAQDTARKIVEELTARRSEITVALEMAPSDRQEALDGYLTGTIDDDEFLEAVDYENTWDFHWEPYRRLLSLCRREGLRVIAINSDPRSASNRVVERDFHAAKLIAAEALARPGALIFVLTGDLHVARDHLPLMVDSQLQRSGARRRSVVVHQNAEPIYWRLAELGLDREADVVRIADGCYCVLSATPLVKLQSYLNWEQNHEDLCTFVHPSWHLGRGAAVDGDEEVDYGTDYAEKMHELVRTIADFLEIDAPDLDSFSVYTTGDLDFLARLEKDRRFTAREVAEIKRQIQASESYFIARARIIYLADLSIHRAAEEAAHFINTVCGGFDGAAREPRDAFYYRAVKEAIGFFGSRIIDRKRTCWSFQDFRDFLAANRGRRLPPEEQALRRIGRLSLRHREAERRWIHEEKFGGVGSVYGAPPEVLNGVAHALGYILGDKLHNALCAGGVTKKYVRDLFYDPLAPGTAEARYFELLSRLHRVKHGVPSERERF